MGEGIGNGGQGREMNGGRRKNRKYIHYIFPVRI
jgi:hypothetical protein